jgi:hypothetical protein
MECFSKTIRDRDAEEKNTEKARIYMKESGMGGEIPLKYANYAANYESDGGKLAEKWWFA